MLGDQAFALQAAGPVRQPAAYDCGRRQTQPGKHQPAYARRQPEPQRHKRLSARHSHASPLELTLSATTAARDAAAIAVAQPAEIGRLCAEYV